MRPVLIINPRSDTTFVETVGSASASVTDPGELQALLRSHYPTAVVRPRELSSEPITVWYVYRDGRWIPDRVE